MVPLIVECAFNKAYYVAYGLAFYGLVGLKTNYLTEYMTGLLASAKDDKDKSAVHLNECRRMGIRVLCRT
ncbi:hypothetical protein [Streptomyces roseolus]